MGNSIEGGFQQVPPLYLRDLRRKTDRRYRSLVMSGRPRSPSVVEKETMQEKKYQELTTKSVAEYIISNPDFLDEFVSGHISQDRVRAWLKDPIEEANERPPDDKSKELGPKVSSDPSIGSDEEAEKQGGQVTSSESNVGKKVANWLEKVTGSEKTSAKQESTSEKSPKWSDTFTKEVTERGFRQRRLLLVTRSRLLYPLKYKHEELSELIERPLSASFSELNSHLFPYTEIPSDDISKVFIQMATKLLGKHAFPMAELCYFLTTLKANYNNVEYHNYSHALSHAQSMYWILRKNPGVFTELEMKALLIASISHDVGHPGLDESYMRKVFSNMQIMYDSPLLENHHTQTCFLILQDLKCNVFCDLDAEDYKQVLEDLKHAILSTTIDRYKMQVEKLRQITDAGLNLDKGYVRKSVKSLMMMACDLCSSWKRWEEHKNIVWCLYKEFYNQSDKEMKLGLQSPVYRMRVNADNIPKSQVGFMESIALPIFKLLSDIFPTVHVINKDSKENLECWRTYK